MEVLSPSLHHLLPSHFGIPWQADLTTRRRLRGIKSLKVLHHSVVKPRHCSGKAREKLAIFLSLSIMCGLLAGIYDGRAAASALDREEVRTKPKATGSDWVFLNKVWGRGCVGRTVAPVIRR